MRKLGFNIPEMLLLLYLMKESKIHYEFTDSLEKLLRTSRNIY